MSRRFNFGGRSHFFRAGGERKTEREKESEREREKERERERKREREREREREGGVSRTPWHRGFKRGEGGGEVAYMSGRRDC